MTPEEKKQAKKELASSMQEILMTIKIAKAVVAMDSPEKGELLLDVLHEGLEEIRARTGAPAGLRKAMLSQPMAGKCEDAIVATREKAMAALQEKGFFVINTLFTDEWYSKESMEKRGVVQIPLCFLAKSLENMSLCHAAYFCKGWENARGCRIEHEAAKAYGLEIIYEE